jgi:uncharacterized protein (DUF433 family)
LGVDRFGTLLYSVGEAAAYLGVPSSTLMDWAYGYEWRLEDGTAVAAGPVITATRPTRRYDASMPFVGLAEAYTLAVFRQAGVPMQRIRAAIDLLRHDLGVEYPLASRRLQADGAELMYDYTQPGQDDAQPELVVVRSSQQVFGQGTTGQSLDSVEFADDGYARAIRLPQYRVAEVIVDAGHGFGRPRFGRTGVGVEDVVSLCLAGETTETVAEEFGLTRAEVEDAVHVAARTPG